jgi:hypothetical protein
VVRHAGPETFEELRELLGELRSVPGLVERNSGTFYRRSKAFLHFHEDPDGPFADLRVEHDGDFVRYRVRTATERRRLLTTVRTAARS